MNWEDRKQRSDSCESGKCPSCGKDYLNHLGLTGTCKLLQLALLDFAETDTFVRKEALKVLTEKQVNGDSYGIPGIEDIVSLLVSKIELNKNLGY